ncbi:hypothetical protein JCM10213_007161 [Rhodosporidiobolus nylandii]
MQAAPLDIPAPPGQSTSTAGGAGWAGSYQSSTLAAVGLEPHQQALEFADADEGLPFYATPADGVDCLSSSTPQHHAFESARPATAPRAYSTYSVLEDQHAPTPRSYSTTSDIRGTLDHSRGPTVEADAWSTFGLGDSQSSYTESYRRDSEPSIRHQGEHAHFHPRASLPYPSERADALPVRRLRRSLQLGSPGGYTASSTPSLTEGSTSPSTTRSSFVGSPYGVIAEDPRFHGSTPYADIAEEAGYPFPSMYEGQQQQQQLKPPSRHSFSGAYQSSTPRQELNINRKRQSASPIEEYGEPSPQLHSAFGNFSFRSSTNTSSSAYAPAAPSGLERVLSRHGPTQQPFGVSPRNGVYDIDGARQIFLPNSTPLPWARQSQQQASDLLPPHDSYEGAKKRRMSSADSFSGSLSTRREAASSLHLEGLPPPPLADVPFEGAQEQPHFASTTRHSFDHNAGTAYPLAPGTPSAPVNRRLSYASFASPSYAPLPSLDSPGPSPRKDSRAPISPFDHPAEAFELPIPPPQHAHAHSHPPGGSCCGPPPPMADYLPVPPPSATYPTTPVQLAPMAPPSTFAGFADAQYPSVEQTPFTVCHRRPPQKDFDEPPEGGEPYEQKLRFEEDQYTAKWVRFEKAKREAWCALCPGEGKWLQLKNSAFWYHRQFVHGVSSQSGHYFLPPLELRAQGENGKILGLCHSCAEWHTYRSGKGGRSDKIPSQWYHHAHKCHTYFSPRKEARKNARLGL